MIPLKRSGPDSLFAKVLFVVTIYKKLLLLEYPNPITILQ